MKKEDWEKAKSRLRAPLGQVDLLCDGYSVTLVNECISMFRNGIAVYVNGELVDESNINMHSQSRTNLGPYRLGEDEYFVMGDNRGNSNDSRAVGPISRDMIVGHVRCVLWPLNKLGTKVE